MINNAQADNTLPAEPPGAAAVSATTAVSLNSSAPIALLESNLTELKRALFRDAVDALENGNLENFETLKTQSKDYILYPYLEYYGLRNRLSSASDDELTAFIENYNDTPLSYKIRTQWLYRLAEDQRWEQYLKIYKAQEGTKLRCAYLHARLATDNSSKTYQAVMNEAKDLWKAGTEQPKECENIFGRFEKSKLLTQQLIWERIDNAMEKGNIPLAGELSKKLVKRDRKQVDLWIDVHKNPANHLDSKKLHERTSINRKIIIHGVQRMARSDAERAKEKWAKLQHKRGFSRQQLGEMQRYIALRSAYQQHPNAYKWLNEIGKNWIDDDVLYWRAMTALRAQDWKALENDIGRLPKIEEEEPKWRYWLARAWEQSGKKEQAKKLFEEIATQTNYYGFLSADRIGISYSFNMEPLPRDEKVIQEITRIPAIQRARELFLVNQMEEARNEWSDATQKFDNNWLKQAALLSHDWEWHHNAIMTVAQA
ncbi:MAG: hypothetical protein L0Z73_00965, partial [Gammaproteobacteria bacterium]|nr:hypothetical protein [Gammaproteobacteria bacterium]